MVKKKITKCTTNKFSEEDIWSPEIYLNDLCETGVSNKKIAKTLKTRLTQSLH